MRIYKQVTWDITGACNSNCRYCCNGRKSLSGKTHRMQAGFLQPKEFENAINYLKVKGTIVPGQTYIDLYDWGEPFLHPEFETMTKIVANNDFSFGLSTNGSILKTIPSESISKLTEMRFSMPGFSQGSYDRIHGFEFDVICGNIRVITEQIRAISSDVPISVAFHLYKFNQSEIILAREFCDKLKIKFIPLYAYFNGFTMAKDYFTGRTSKEDRENITNDLMIDRLEVLRRDRPSEYECPQNAILAIDEFCNVLLCCGTDRHEPGHVIGKLWEVDYKNLSTIRKNTVTCSLCSKLKIDYMWHNANC